MLKQPVQQGRSERRDDVYAVPYVEPLIDVRIPLVDFLTTC